MSASLEAMAATLKAAFDQDDAGRLAPVLAADVRWGGEEETPETCHTDLEALAWYERLRLQGVGAQVEEVLVRESAVVLGLLVTRPSDSAADDRARVWQAFVVSEGLVVEIRGYPDRDAALAFADGQLAA
jgi:hypothetical protein